MAHAKASKAAKGYKNNYANLPQEVRHESYPKRQYAVKDNGEYPDDLNMLDKNASKDQKKLSRSIRSNY